MGKKERSSKHPKLCKKYETSCMCGLINIFDFRQVHPTQKLLTNGRHVNNNVVARAYPKSILNLLNDVDESSRSKKTKTLRVDAGRTVKSLVEEEISTAQTTTKQVTTQEVESLDHLIKSSKNRSKNCHRGNQLLDQKWKESMSLGQHQISHQSSEKAPYDKLNFTAMLVALHNQIHQSSITSEEFDQVNETNLDSQLFLDVKTLNLNKEMFLKLLQDPNSLLAKHIQKLHDLQAEKENSKSSRHSKFSDREEAISPIKFQKQHMYNFLWNKIKNQYGYPSDGKKTPGDSSSRIVVLKPGLRSTESSENVSCHCSSLHSSHSLKSKSRSQKPAYFSFRDIKRKLKFANAEGEKEQQTIVKSSAEAKKKDKIAQAAESKSEIKPQFNKNLCKEISSSSVNYPNRRDFDIHLEAKRHLSERLSNVVQFDTFSSREAPKTLGRILSLPHQDFLLSLSPKRDVNQGFSTAETRISQYTEASPSPSSGAENSKSDDEIQIFGEKPDISENHLLNAKTHESTYTVGDDCSSNDYAKNVETANVTNPGEFDVLEEPSSPSSSHITNAKQSTATTSTCEHSGCLILDLPPQNQKLTSSINLPSSTFLSIQRPEIEGSTKDRTEYQSPVSVLEPFFTEDGARSPSTTPSSAEPPIQPVQLDFEAHSPEESYPDPKTNCGTCMDDHELVSTYIEALHQAGFLNWDKLFLRWNSSGQFIPSLFDELDLPPALSSSDHKLLFDCVNEVAIEVYECCLSCSSYLSFIKPKTRAVRTGETTVDEITKRVDRCLLPPVRPSSLELLTGADLARSGTWIDLRHETGEIVIEMVESILEELISETVLKGSNLKAF